MTALAVERDTKQLANGGALNDCVLYPISANVKCIQGGIAVLTAALTTEPGTTAASKTMAGMFAETKDNTGGAAGALFVRVLRGVFKWAIAPIVATVIGTSPNGALSLVPNQAGVTFAITNPGTNAAAEVVTVTGTAISVASRYASSAMSSTGATMLAAVLASTAAMALLTSAALATTADGTGVCVAVGATALAYDNITQVGSTAYVVDDQTMGAVSSGRSGSTTVVDIAPDGVFVKAGVS